MLRQFQVAAVTALMACVVMIGATVVAAAPNLAGTWTFTFDSDRGGRDVAIEIAQDGTTLTAKMEGATLTGSLNGDAFDLSGELYVNEAGRTGPMTLHGQVGNEKLTGKGVWDTLDLSFTAVRAR